MAAVSGSANFGFLARHEPALLKLASQAERYFADDPNTCLMKIRQFAEILARHIAIYTGIAPSASQDFLGLLDDLEADGILRPEVGQIFHQLRKVGNVAVHDYAGTHRDALYCLRQARELAIWFHRSFSKDKNFNPGPFIPPPDPHQKDKLLSEELERLKKELTHAQESAKTARTEAEQETQRRALAEQLIEKHAAELNVWRQLAEESEEQLAAERARLAENLAKLQEQTAAAPAQEIEQRIAQAQQAAKQINLSEADTRRLIDQQLRDAGWAADSQALTWKSGARPVHGKNQAIAEVPVQNGVADYVLFIGALAVGTVEAKKKSKDVAAAIGQAKRYSENLEFIEGMKRPGGPWGKFQAPFLFATNGRPYLRQLETKSGIWFLDARDPKNHARALEGWYTPQGLEKLLEQDHAAAAKALQNSPKDYLPLRDYQKDALQAVEEALASGRRNLMVAMATGTGKTITCIGLVYRLLKAKRFRRVLFLVDRSALGEQAANVFKSVRLENLQTFADVYEIKELGDLIPEPDTRLHIATIQSMIHRLFFPQEEDKIPPVDAYDCIIVDECHRGYTLDREMSDAELDFRGEQDYISKYRRVLDHFDAVRIGLTATPALHTVEIFGEPVFNYSYRQAVIDGYLVDHEPPIRIVTALAQNGMTWQTGEEMKVYDGSKGQLDLFRLPDEVTLEIEAFNKRVVTEKFNQVICAELAKHIDPALDEKTLIFCATDQHADLVVHLLKKAMDEVSGGVDDDAIVKITGSADQPLQLIRRFKNEKLPNIAVTVDLLTTGIDVPSICNLVFLRRVRSRILYEQMIGRATRLCAELNKERFRIFDAVALYDALDPYTSMKPVVHNPEISFQQLTHELSTVPGEASQQEILDQLLAKLQRKKQSLTGQRAEDFQALTGMQVQDVLHHLRHATLEQARDWFAAHPQIAAWLDKAGGLGQKLIISEHEDEVIEVSQNYGKTTRPEDYLDAFGRYLKEHINEIPALLLVTQRPRDLTRQQLKEVRLALDAAGFPESALQAAWRNMTNQDIAARIIGFIRRQALGSPLKPYEERVDAALKKLLASRPWTAPQRKWLERIGKQLKAEVVVDRDALNRGQFQAEGGFDRLNKIFEGQLEQLLSDLQETVWQDAG